MINKVHGNITGIRDTELEKLGTLYDYPIARDEFIPAEMLEYIAAFSASINREISVYISREGDVLDITVGGNDSVPLQDWHMRRSASRLSRVRCIHTHPGGNPYLSAVDLSALRSLMLDSISACGVSADGRITGVTAAFPGAKLGGERQIRQEGPLSVRALQRSGWMELIEEADRAVDSDRGEETQVPEKALLLGIDSEQSLDELENLAKTAGAVVCARVLQKKDKPDTATFVGSGKAERLSLDAQAAGADLIIVDDELTGIQTRNLEEITGVKVIDRTTLILDIFAQRAKSSEGKLQVALAQMKYRSARLIGQGLILSRLGGGIGTRGPGETKLEMDRRRIRERVSELKKDLEQLVRQREIRKKNRKKNDIPSVALVGYTNTGKSTLLNLLTDAGVYVQDQLFATLDATSRKVALADGGEFLLTDTVGFISKLPHDLVDAFRSTLEEAADADLLVIVSDISDPETPRKRAVVDHVLEELGAADKPVIEVMNKCDREPLCQPIPGAVMISAKSGKGIDRLLSAIAGELRKKEQACMLFIPYSAYAALNDLRKLGRVTEEEHLEDGTRVTVMLSPENIGVITSRYGTRLFTGKP